VPLLTLSMNFFISFWDDLGRPNTLAKILIMKGRARIKLMTPAEQSKGDMIKYFCLGVKLRGVA